MQCGLARNVLSACRRNERTVGKGLHMRAGCFGLTILFFAFFSVSAQADWQRGHVVEGDSAYTVPGGAARLSLLGRSALGLSNRVELSTYLPLDLVLFPNLSLKYRFF